MTLHKDLKTNQYLEKTILAEKGSETTHLGKELIRYANEYLNYELCTTTKIGPK